MMFLFFTIMCFVAIAFRINSSVLAALSMGFTVKYFIPPSIRIILPDECVTMELGGFEFQKTLPAQASF